MKKLSSLLLIIAACATILSGCGQAPHYTTSTDHHDQDHVSASIRLKNVHNVEATVAGVGSYTKGNKLVLKIYVYYEKNGKTYSTYSPDYTVNNTASLTKTAGVDKDSKIVSAYAVCINRFASHDYQARADLKGG